MHLQYLLLTICLCAICCSATLASESYRLPPQDLVDLIDAAPSPTVTTSPNGEWMLIVEPSGLPDIADLSRRMLRLAGIRIDPVANGGFRQSFDKGLLLRKRGNSTSAQTIRIPLPKNGKLAAIGWSHHSQAFAFSVVTAEGTQLWTATTDSPTTPRKLTDRLNTVLNRFQWMPDAKSILCSLVPTGRADEPIPPSVPQGPTIQETSDNNSPTRTYQDLLANANDEELFAYYATTQLAILGIDGTAKEIGQPAIYYGMEPAPNGKLLSVRTVERPFSYLHTIGSFPHRIEVWDLEGNVQHLVAKVPLAENIPIEGVRTGPRSVSWMSNRDATLMWTEALDGGDPNAKADHRDQWMSHAAPFDKSPQPTVKVEHRAFSAAYTKDSNQLITYEYDRDRRWVRALLHDLSQPEARPRILSDRSIRDKYGDPGRFVTEPNEQGHSIVKQDGKWAYRIGSGATPQGMLPFLDRQNLKTLETERLWRCEKESFEAPVSLLGHSDGGSVTFVARHQSVDSPPNYVLHEDGKRTALTTFADPTPQLRGIKKQLVKYQRDDGVELSATMYLPADYKEGTKLPLLIWAYPIEFNDPDTAGQVGSSPWLFTRIRGSSHLALVTQGYAVMDGATIPIIGDPETMNDTFVEQMVAGAKAAIDKAVAMGIAERHRVAVAGHSYGAFMTVNLMAHCDLFQAGIARSGAYNRTLTPFGFQSERRPLWEAKDVYFNISPFMHADKINEPLLLVHGEDDNNSGTFPMQSKRLFQAIKGNGGTARLVMLPKESHGYRARESVLHVHAETLDWLAKYVKNNSPNESIEARGTAAK